MTAAAVATTAMTLSGCISSTVPVLSDSKPLLGERGLIHSYSIHDGLAHDPKIVPFEWTGDRYRLRGRSLDISEFTALPFEGRDFVVQTKSTRGARLIEYGLARRLADGVYLVIPIDEADADDETRVKFCTKTKDAFCQITTPEQLFAFARVTADKTLERGGLVVVLPSAKR